MDRYEEALERAKKGLPIDEVFPELKESEDERIRKALIGHLKAGVDFVSNGVTKAECIAWLEKKKEQKPESCDCSRDEESYTNGIHHVLMNPEAYGLIKQKPAESDAIKGGDFISDGKRVFLVLANVKERNLGETGSTFCEGHILGVDGVVYCDGDNFKKFKRATSDERAKFIHDLKVGVELKEQPAEWSEEDNNALVLFHELISFGYTERFCDAQTAEDMRRWLNERLKSTRPQPHWKPSKEQMEALNAVANEGVLLDLFNDLLKLL